MDDNTTYGLSIIVILLTLSIIALLSLRRKTPFPLRRIGAYEIVPALVGNAIEADRPIHLSLGSAGLGGASTLLSIASAEFAYHMIERAAIGDTSPIVTLSDASVLPMAQDSLRRAYQSRGLGAGYKSINARWYPAGSRSLAFAAAITALMGDDRVSSNVMVGSYGPELALIMDASKRRSLPIIAVSDQLEGQAVAYALADYPLIGEEVFASPSYLSGKVTETSRAVIVDVLRWLAVLAMLAGLVAKITNNGG